ncbi:bam [Symbiodinium pilosum]|uniref:Bam protein n=2 Tax=Symbiodinium TaxID=2949 RepID=A0A812IRF7_SYMPI|nr:bam [Symbiodinium pilosum]CAE7149218.1 bam [Symbiodinium necroappetens]
MKLWQLSAIELASGISKGEFTATQVVTEHLERIKEVNAALNAIVVVMAETAIKSAAEVDRARAKGERLGPLAGVPMTIKENIDCVGTATTQGVPALAEAFPTMNSPIVDRMLAAGAIPIGRTNLPEMGLRLHTDNALRGPTINPWNADRTTGGSSGGEAVALATGMSPIGLGNDIGGSLRNPANCCGIASIKPTQGIVPHAVTIPSEDEPISFQLMLSDGPMARRVADVRLGLDLMRGHHPRDPNSMSAELSTIDRPLKIALMAEPPGGDTDSRIADVTRNAASALEAAGCIVTQASPPGMVQMIELWTHLLDNDVSLTLPLLAPLLSGDAMAFLEDFRDGRQTPSVEDYGTWLTTRMAVSRQWATFFGEHDLLLSPTWTQLPFHVGWDIAQKGRAVETMQQARCIMPGNALGLPSACVPSGMVDGMPVGVLLTGGRFSDYLCLDGAAMIETALGVETPIDPR